MEPTMLFKVEKEDGLHDVYEARPDGNVIVEYREKSAVALLAFCNIEPERTADIPFFVEFKMAA